MLTLIKEVFTWWNRQTLGTRLQTLFFGKIVGQDKFGNKYYQSRNGRRWVIYKNEVDASTIPNEWYSWIHFTSNKIENNHSLEKFHWQKQHLPNQTGTKNAYHPNKNNHEIKKRYKNWKN